MEKINQLLRLQEDRLEQIQKSQTNYKKAPKERLVLNYLETRLESLEKDWQIFRTSHEHLVSYVAKEQRTALSYFSDDLYEKCEEIYISYKSDVKTKIRPLTQVQEAHTMENKNAVAKIKLPTITIPTFSGQYTDWPTFQDLFTSIIHNNQNLDDVQKLHYLKSSLTGEAQILLRNISVTSQNYELAWKTLHNRYNNKRYISNCIFKRLFGTKNITTESAPSIKELLDSTVECLSALKNLGLPTDSWDAIIIYVTVTKLDSESQKLWEQHISTKSVDTIPALSALTQFLETRFRSLEMVENTTKSSKFKTFHASAPTTSSAFCAYCKGNHYIYQCKQFSSLPFTNRHEFVQNNNLCFNCLIPNHSVAKCLRNTSCRICQRKHHSLLHPEEKEQPLQNSNESGHEELSEKITSHVIGQSGQVLLATALVDVVSRNATRQACRALIDQGSQASFVTEDLVQSMNLKKERINGWVSGLSDNNPIPTRYIVEIQLMSRCNPDFTILVKAYVLKKITNYSPTTMININNWPELHSIRLADPAFNTCEKIQILLGAEVYTQIIDPGLLKSPSGIIAQHTQLGWILTGGTGKYKTDKQLISMHLKVNVGELLKRFWEIENETLTIDRQQTKEEKTCEKIYQDTTRRTETGRYEINLPFKEDVESPEEKIGNTKEMAMNRFLQLERRFKRDPKLCEEYTKVINEYMELGHMRLADENTEGAVYLPHHAVIRNDKDTTKVRTVFDASAKGSKGFSLNDTLLIGPKLQKDLRTVIMEWRQHKVAIISDIVKMYRQVLVTDKHTKYQRIIWRNNPDKECKSYELLTVTFGTASAPYLAVRTLLQLVDDDGYKYPLAADAVKNSFYMDDMMTGAPDVATAFKIYSQVTQLLRGGGFELQKWSSNSGEFLQKITQRQDLLQPFEIKFDQVIRTLGLSWDRVNDKFKFTVNQVALTYPITKRSVLAEVARLFDPFGWLAPTIIKAKIFIQRLWLCTVDWDDDLPSELEKEWLAFREQLPNLQNIELNRWIYTHPGNQRVELHGFADASTTAYAAVLYIRVIQDDDVFISILESKTKVAPLKQISVARLELCAAVLLARIISEAAHALKLNRNQIYAYTDSMVVLAWIQASPMRWQTFVANRVTEIQNRLNNEQWNHVNSEENPADMASRGIDPSELQYQQLWWKGPHWLSFLHLNKTKGDIIDTDLEQRKQHITVHHCKEKEESIWERFSNLNRMIRVLTYCKRFLRLNSRKKYGEEQPRYLTWNEMKETLNVGIKISQEKMFGEEILDLKDKGRVKKRSKLASLSPYLDDAGLLRVGGRLQASNIPHDYKHPVIISKSTHLARLLVKDAHLKLLHGGMALTINYLRARYWIIGVKPLVKACCRKCATCLRHRALIRQPKMSTLPKERVTPSRPFKISGVDFAGPIQIRTSKGRGQGSYKGYICLFICLATRAIHLEVVSDLTTKAFIAAYRRFVSRRGHCSELWSDNGLNFVGAAKELKTMLQQSMKEVLPEVAELLSNDGTSWRFIPPRAPNFGGIWEAGIKSVKGHLTKIIGNSTLTFEEMTTLLNQIEACLNSRPIGQLTDHPSDLTPLTPGHFLTGEPLITLPEPHDETEPISPLHRWKLVQRMMIHFWKRWSKEYLHTMQQRYKWQNKTEAPKVDDVVIVKEDNLPPTKWMLGRVIRLHPGPDGETRVVDLRSKDSTFKRPLSKIILLPSEEEHQ